YLVLAYTPVDVQSDFSYELTIELPVENLTDKCGLVFGYLSKGSDGTRAPLEYFSVGNNRRMVMGNRSWYSFYTELDLPYIIPGGRNKLKVFKTSNMLYYFVNDIYSYCSEMETKEPGNVFGFTVPPMAEILVHNFVVSRKGLAKSAMGKVKSQPLEFEIIKSEFETNKIKPNN
ncbi:MAG TPA: hypothetical protein VK152_03945, partial [Paludibacter sp.]|nr:hypothetical protein [Paludibacter sp.]